MAATVAGLGVGGAWFLLSVSLTLRREARSYAQIKEPRAPTVEWHGKEGLSRRQHWLGRQAFLGRGTIRTKGVTGRKQAVVRGWLAS